MKLALLLVVFTLFQANADVLAQEVSIDVHNAPLSKVLKELKKQTGYDFLYASEDLKSAKLITLHVKSEKIENVLEACFRKQPLDYEITNTTVLIRKKKGKADLPAYVDALPAANQREVSGHVTNDAGEALEGVTVSEKNGAILATTAVDGSFRIRLPSDRLIVIFTMVGYIPREITLGDRAVEQVVLKQMVSDLDEVVITGYSREKKSEITGSVSVVSMKDVKDIANQNPLQSVQGRVPGLYVQKDGYPGGGTRRVLIRGMNTLGTTTPLYIIDGHPASEGILNNLDPNSIESMQVLKDAAAASIYGSRASNGVIIITTKEAKSGESKIDVNSTIAVEDYFHPLERLNTIQRGQVLWQASINDRTDPNQDHPHYTFDWNGNYENPILNNIDVIEYLNATTQGGIKSGDTDWFDEISQVGLQYRNSVSFRNGGERHNVFFNLGHLKHKGTIKYTGYERFSGRVNADFKMFGGRLKVGENLQLYSGNQTPMGDGQGGSVLHTASLVLPILPVYAEDGSFAGPIGPAFSNRENPLHLAELTKDWKNTDLSLFGNIYMELEILKGLLFKSSYGLDYRIREQERVNPRYTAGFMSRQINNYSHQMRKDNNWSWFNTLNYNATIERHQLNILAGMEASEMDYRLIEGRKEDFLLETIDYFYLDAGVGAMNLVGNGSANKLLSYFSKINYSFDGKYLLSATLRYDGSSRFGKDNRFGFFPAVSLGWNMKSEAFLRDNATISRLMLRAGTGRIGNQQIGDNAAMALLVPSYGSVSSRRPTGTAYDITGANSGTLPSGVVRRRTENVNLRWETTEELNLGLDFGFLKDRVFGSFDYFSRNTSGILIQPPYLSVMGEGGNRYENGATMSNKGWEVAIGLSGGQRDFTYTVSGSLGHFRDKVTYLPQSVVRSYAGNIEKTIIGRPISSLFGYVTDGIFQNQTEVEAHATQPGKGVGRIRYRDLNHDGVIDVLDQDWLGEAIPDLEFGLNSSLSYKRFSLTFFLQGLTGRYELNANKNQSDLLGAFAGQNNSPRLLQAWTPQNPNASIPAVSNFDANNETRTSDYQIENTSYLKLRNIQLAYSLPQTVQRKLGMSNCQLFISGIDLLTIKSKDFTNPDPEAPNSFYPIPRTIIFGCNITF